jgi:hypothetical protein
MTNFMGPDATEGTNPTPAPTSGQPGIGYDDTLPPVEPGPQHQQPQIIAVDWPPATPQGPSDPADTPGWKDQDDITPATEGGADGMTINEGGM